MLTNSTGHAERAAWIIDLCRALYPVRGLIVSPDLDRAFSQIKQVLPELIVHEYPTGMQCEDWIVPQSWEALSGRIEDDAGAVLASLDDSFLFVAPYSEPVDGWFSKAEIGRHLRTRPEQPDAYVLEHRNAYDFRLTDWGITLPHAVWERMSETARYRVVVETLTKPGALKVAELVLPGRRTETICICSQFDELCNDGQSSAVLGLDVMRQLMRRREREFTYQLLLVPEMFGTIFYVLNNKERVSRTAGMLNLETIGAGEKWLHKASLDACSIFDRALHLAFAEADVPYQAADFFEGYGNDERVYAWPSIGIPGVALQRYPFAYYHTHHDTPDVLSHDLVIEAMKIADAFIDILERDYVPRYRNVAQPWLTRHGLYFDHAVDPREFQRLNNVALFSLDGRRSLSEVAKMAGLPFGMLWNYLETFVACGLVDKLPIHLELPAGRLARARATVPTEMP
jgi:aminopeptidase-like protein